MVHETVVEVLRIIGSPRDALDPGSFDWLASLSVEHTRLLVMTQMLKLFEARGEPRRERTTSGLARRALCCC